MKKLLLTILALGALLGGSFFAWKFSDTSTPPQASPQASVVTSPAPEPSVSPSPGTRSPSSTPQPSPTDETLIKMALAGKIGISEEFIEFSITQKEGVFAKGMIGLKGESSGGYFLAKKTGAKWTIVYDGQAQPECKSVSDFPRTMVPECVDAEGNVVAR